MISVDISDSYAYLLESNGKSNNIAVKHQKVIPLENKVILENKVDKEALRSVLAKLFEGVTTKKVAITYSAIPTISNGYRLPHVNDEKELKQIILSKAVQTLASEDFVLDYRISKLVRVENETHCDVVTYLVPREVISDTIQVIKEFNRIPEKYYILQDSIFNFACKFVPEQTVIICNITKKIVTLHLINKPNNVITRTSNIEESNSLDLLNVLQKEEGDVIDETKSQLSKLLQYQAIKSAERNIEAIYIMGELGNLESLNKIKEEFSENIKLLSEIKLPFAVNESIYNGHIYALSAFIKPE